MPKMIFTIAALVSVAFGFTQPGTAQTSQSWPSRPVKLILPLGPGSGTDTIARVFADRLATQWGKSVVIENRPGGDGIIAITAFLSANDDHTLLFTASSAFTGHPYLHEKLPYDPRALIPVARVADTLVVVAPLTSTRRAPRRWANCLESNPRSESWNDFPNSATFKFREVSAACFGRRE